jgi:hypothetical protein
MDGSSDNPILLNFRMERRRNMLPLIRKISGWWMNVIFIGLLVTPAATQYQIGDKVNNFALYDLQGKFVSLSDFEGKAILLNFFATW